MRIHGRILFLVAALATTGAVLTSGVQPAVAAGPNNHLVAHTDKTDQRNRGTVDYYRTGDWLVVCDKNSDGYTVGALVQHWWDDGGDAENVDWQRLYEDKKDDGKCTRYHTYKPRRKGEFREVSACTAKHGRVVFCTSKQRF